MNGFADAISGRRLVEFGSSWRNSANRTANALGTDARFIIGAALEERADVFFAPLHRSQLPQSAMDWFASARFRNHEDISRDAVRLNAYPPPDMPNAWQKLNEPLLIDLGPANIRGLTAIRALERYLATYKSDDPLNLRRFQNAYPAFLRQIASGDPDVNTAVIGLLAVEASAYFSTHPRFTQIHGNWGDLTPGEQAAWVTVYYNIGRERLAQRMESSEIALSIDGMETLANISVIGAIARGEPLPDGETYRATSERGQIPRCFLPGTPILMADGTEKPIEQVRIGDLVLAFDAAALGRGALVPRPVTRTFQNITQTIIDLRGTRMTPGHVCLTDHGRFETIAAILARDGALVDRHGTPLRARTGARLGSPEDTPVAIVFADPATSENQRVTLRAGIPCLTRTGADGTPETLSLVAALAELGATILPDGRLQSAEGRIGTSTDWPEGTTPLDTHAQRNWIVTGPDGQPYTPGWIAELEEEAAHEQAIGATTRRITASLGSGVAGGLGGLPQIGAWAATLPRIGSAVPRIG